MEKKAKKCIEIIGFPMDLGADKRGVDMGPSALRIAGLKNRLTRLGHEVIDHGDVFIQNRISYEFSNPKLKYLEEIVKRSEKLAQEVEQVLLRGHFPLCLGGDHSIALGSIAGVSSFCRQKGREVGVIWIDAHPDMNTDKTTPSGNIHGMPLSASLGLGNSALVQLHGFSPKVKPENCALIGIRSVDLLEKEEINKQKLPIYSMADIDKEGVHQIISKVLEQMKKNVQHIHVSFDVDSADPKIAPGVGTPVPGGLTYREVHVLMEAIAECGCMSSLEVSEVNPILDNKNTSAELAVDVVASSLGQRIY